MPPHEIKAVLFDFMGTCLDWHSSVVAALPMQLDERSQFALNWRQRYFDSNAKRVKQSQPPEDFDNTLRAVLLTGDEGSETKALFTPDVIDRLIVAWHNQKAWTDVAPAIEKLRKNGYEVFVHANGTTRLQLDLCRSSGLQFHSLFSSELLGYIKPDLEAYRKGLRLIRRSPDECVMVAAHAYDTRGAKAVGMKIVYVYRWTDNIHEDQAVVKAEHDAYLNDMNTLVEVIERLGQ
ncbi:hypothetical protein LTR78_004592 [Recurvomyces mirabilis]|uniref:Uncharacterized protein n=1 Tax=Recurvomyces mirabilis TaxID=574656 RepID=A0AAE0WPR0_9PEZI|nr:hypothetical protein LTR78_004592 [Recurvomyces mirabilis]KAK5152914.1 hypothetical protein LTS14_008022 [Recurvomyces mirabilis]